MAQIVAHPLTAERPTARSLMALRIGETLSSGFDPVTLFANGEQGILIDPSNLNTLFQERANAQTPAAVGDPVGTVLDLSQGAKSLTNGLEAELAANPNLDSDTVWSKGTGWSISGGVATLDGTNSGSSLLGQTLTLDAATFYLFSFEVLSATGIGFRPELGGDTSFGYTNEVGVHTFLVRSNGTDTLNIRGNGGVMGSVGKVSLRKLPGNHITAPSDAARPILRQTAGGVYYLEHDGIDDTLVTPDLDMGAASTMAGGFIGLEDDVVVQRLIGSTQASYQLSWQVTTVQYGVGNFADNSGRILVATPGAPTVVVARRSVPNNTINIRADGGAQENTNTHDQVAVSAPYGTFSRTNNDFGEGGLGPLVMLDRYLTDAEVADLESWLAERSGLTL